MVKRKKKKGLLTRFVRVALEVFGITRVYCLIPDGEPVPMKDGLEVSATEDPLSYEVTLKYSYLTKNGTKRIKPIRVPLSTIKETKLTYQYEDGEFERTRGFKAEVLGYEEGKELYLSLYPDCEEDLIEAYGSEELRARVFKKPDYKPNYSGMDPDVFKEYMTGENKK